MVLVCIVVSIATTIICSRIILESNMKDWELILEEFSETAKKMLYEATLGKEKKENEKGK